MNNAKQALARAAGALAVLGTIVVGLAALSTDARAVRPPGPLCGPTILFECTYRNGSTHLVGLTACEVDAYEKKHHASCVPY